LETKKYTFISYMDDILIQLKPDQDPNQVIEEVDTMIK